MVFSVRPNYWKKDSAGNQFPYLDSFTIGVVSAANTRIGNYRPGMILPFSLLNVDELFVKR